MRSVSRHIAASLLLLLMFVVSAAHAQLPFEVNESGHILIKAKINGVEGKFIFDTGAGLNAIFTNFSHKISNQRTPNFFVGHRATGEELNLDLYNATAFEVNGQPYEGQQYAIVDLQFGDIDGIISLQPFRNTTVTIDRIHKQLFFNRSTKGQKSIDIQVSDIAGKAIDIFTYVQLNDSLRIQVMLDSGAGKRSYWFSSKFIEPLSLNKKDLKAVPVKSDFNKQNNYYVGKLSKLSTTGNLRSIENFDMAFVDGLIYEGKTSIDWLGQVITIDLAKKKIFIAQ